MTATGINTAEIFDALEKFINRRAKLDKADYGLAPSEPTDRRRWIESWRNYQREKRSVSADGTRARRALAAARLLPSRPEILLNSFRAYSGRLQWIPQIIHEGMTVKEARLEYTTGQYFPTEYRKAAASVLETYVSAVKQALARENPQTFTYTDMSDVVTANESIGGHWFEPATMRFFKTKIVSRLIAGHRFVTSEQGPHGPRLYTIREAKPDGEIETVGEFQGYVSKKAAMRDILMDPKVKAK